MEHNLKDLGAYRIHHCKTDKYKKIFFVIEFRKPIKKEELTKVNLLEKVLISGSKKYPTDRLINIAKEELYGATFGVSKLRLGNYYHTYIYANILMDKYTEKGNFNKTIKLLTEILLNPLVKNNKFNTKIVEREKRLYKDYLESVKDSPGYYARLRAKETYNNKSPISYRNIGYLDGLKDINPSNLYEYYKEFLRTNLLDIYVVGNIEFKETIELIKNSFKDFNVIKRQKEKYYVEDKILTKKKTNIEKINNKQSQLVMIYKANRINEIERKYLLPMYADLLGGDPTSKLFTIIREQKSICYSINSAYNVLDNVMYITVGIDKNNYKETLKEIEKIVENKNLITEKDVKDKIVAINTNLDNKLEYNSTIADYLEEIDIFKFDDLETRKKTFNKITKKEIIKASKKLKLQNIYLLEGDYNEKD